VIMLQKVKSGSGSGKWKRKAEAESGGSKRKQTDFRTFCLRFPLLLSASAFRFPFSTWKRESGKCKRKV
jgi:hypothetical protein